MDVVSYSRFFFALAFIIGLIWALAYVARRSGFDKKLRGVTGQRGRLAVSDVIYLDPKRKLMLVRADAREYLLLVMGETVQVIDRSEAPHETVA